jgi:hypothetical protein
MRYRPVALGLLTVALCSGGCGKRPELTTTVEDPVELEGISHVIESCKLATPAVYVNNETDILHHATPDACPFTGTGDCSLRDAIGFANRRGTFCSVGNHNTHIYLQNVTYTLTLPADRTLEITSETIIHGRGAIIEGAAQLTASIGSVFHVAKGANVGMSDVTIQHGSGTYGGAIQNDGSVSLANCVITRNHAVSGGGGLAGGQFRLSATDVTENTTDNDGGGIAAVSVTIQGGTIRNNQAIRGGGIFNSGWTDLERVTLSANSSTDGGGFFNDAWTAVHGWATTFSSNVANRNGGGLYNARGGQVDMTDVHVLDNRAVTGSGGGIYSIYDGIKLPVNYSYSSVVNLVDCEVRRNIASGSPGVGGIDNEGVASLEASAVLSLRNCAVDRNVGSGLAAGGIVNGSGGSLYMEASELDSNRGGGVGGMLNGGTSDIRGSTISRNVGTSNVAGFGGIWNENVLKMINVTISGNIGVPYRAGGLFNGADGTAVGKAEITYSTIAFNTLGVEVFSGVPGISTVVSNSIIANNKPGPDCSIPLTSNGHNLESSTKCAFTASSDRQSVDPRLGSLTLNAPVSVSKAILRATHALLTGSRAIDAGSNAGCPATDERGVPRPQGSACDIGAFEAER